MGIIVKKATLEEFIQKAIEVHGDKYRYSKVNYINSRSKIIIICPDHGEFEQTPVSHIRGQGCPKCKAEKLSNLKFSNTEEFIQKATEVHGNKYDYSKVIYTGCFTKVLIICKKHGEFQQVANYHLMGNGCPNCKSSKGELVIKAILDKYNITDKQEYRIPEVADELYYDFYLPEYRLLIEFHGKQHYEYIPFFHDGRYSFEDQKVRDDVVRDAATRWKYRYLEFNYKQLKQLTKEQFEELVLNSINRFKKNVLEW